MVTVRATLELICTEAEDLFSAASNEAARLESYLKARCTASLRPDLASLSPTDIKRTTRTRNSRFLPLSLALIFSFFLSFFFSLSLSLSLSFFSHTEERKLPLGEFVPLCRCRSSSPARSRTKARAIFESPRIRGILKPGARG